MVAPSVDPQHCREIMTKVMRIHANGGPEVLCWEDVDLPPPGPGEAQVRHTAIGVNYSDVNVRRGGFYLAHKATMPITLGNAAGRVVEQAGAGATDLHAGAR